MVNKVVLPIPLMCLYEGRIAIITIKVYEVRLLRSGKPYRVFAKTLDTKNGNLKPFDFEYLDEDSKESILSVLNDVNTKRIQYPQTT